MTISAVQLLGGGQMPAVGLGFWKVPRPAAAELVVEAVRAGYRHFDCACDYGNEAEIGHGLAAATKQGLCRREELWITSKLWNTYHARQHVRPAVERSLRDLQLDYLDLYLIHFPIAQKFVPFEVRYPPEWFYDPGRASRELNRWVSRSARLGVRWKRWLRRVWFGTLAFVTSARLCLETSYARNHPAVLQVELHPYLTQEKLMRFCRERQIAVTGFSPLGAQSYHSIGMARPEESVLDEPVVRQAAGAHGKTPAQIVLRWGVQRGTAVVPKTSHAARLRENLAVFDFELTADEMRGISELDRGRRFNDPGDFAERAFHTFFPIYE